jgi:cytoskeletal protein CcmA (bactofilin family)
MLGRRKDNGRGFDMLGRRKDHDGTASTGPEATGNSANPRMYRTDSTMAPVMRPPVMESPRRAADVTAVTGRRADVLPSGPEDPDSKKLVVGQGIALSGEIRACDRLIVDGQVEATLSDSRSIEISATGVFKGKAQIEQAEISGRFEGELVVSQKLIIHASGRVMGNIRYGEIEIARGGVISGQIDVIETAAADAPPAADAALPETAIAEGLAV